jgi:hypothetical protein
MLAVLLLQSARFLPPTPVLLEFGAFSATGGHVAPAVADVTGDGLDDLALGFFSGQIALFKNEGTREKPLYRTATRLEAGGEAIRVDAGCCIGSAPVFVDLDGDKVLDLVSGSHKQGVVFFRGLGAGKFAAGRVLVEPSFDTALAPALADWDGDGDLDMVLGSVSGAVYLLTNTGGLAFAEPLRLTSEGVAISAQHGGPALYDFNGDGAFDLLLGDVFGNLNLYYSKGKGGTDFAAGKSVMPPFPREPRPGVNLKPIVYDWNRDGKPDILVGDYRPDGAPVVPKSAEQEAEVQRLTARSSALAYQIFVRTGELEAMALKEAGITALAKATQEQRAKYDAALARLTASDKDLAEAKEQKRLNDLLLESAKGTKSVDGTLWVLYGL